MSCTQVPNSVFTQFCVIRKRIGVAATSYARLVHTRCMRPSLRRRCAANDRERRNAAAVPRKNGDDGEAFRLRSSLPAQGRTCRWRWRQVRDNREIWIGADRLGSSGFSITWRNDLAVDILPLRGPEGGPSFRTSCRGRQSFCRRHGDADGCGPSRSVRWGALIVCHEGRWQSLQGTGAHSSEWAAAARRRRGGQDAAPASATDAAGRRAVALAFG